MRILHTCHIFLPHPGGSEYAVHGLSRALAERGHEVVVATGTGGGGPATEEMDGFRVLRFALPGDYLKYVLGSSYDVRMLFGYNVWSTDDLAPRATEIPRPWVFVPCGRIVQSLPFEQIMAADPDAVVALTSREDMGLLLPLGVSQREFKDALPSFKLRHRINGPMALHVGGYWQNKRVESLIAAIGTLPDVTLVCLGNGPLADLLPIRGRDTVLLGALRRDEVVSAFSECDVVVSASSFEGFGLYLLEAMAARKPWVSTDVGATCDLKGGITVAGPEQIAKAVQHVLDSPVIRRELLDEAIREIPAYDWPELAKQWESLYEAVLMRHEQKPESPGTAVPLPVEAPSQRGSMRDIPRTE